MNAEKNAIAPTRSSLSPARRWLLEQCQILNFGRIESLQVRGGEPVAAPAPKMICEFKFGSADKGARPERGIRDFALKSQVVELFALLDKIGDGVVDLVEVKHGLPFRALIRHERADSQFA